MSPRLPTIEQILDIAEYYDMHFNQEDAASFRGLMAGSMASYARLDELAEPTAARQVPASSLVTVRARRRTSTTPGIGRRDIKGSGQWRACRQDSSRQGLHLCGRCADDERLAGFWEATYPEVDATVVTPHPRL